MKLLNEMMGWVEIGLVDTFGLWMIDSEGGRKYEVWTFCVQILVEISLCDFGTMDMRRI